MEEGRRIPMQSKKKGKGKEKTKRKERKLGNKRMQELT